MRKYLVSAVILTLYIMCLTSCAINQHGDKSQAQVWDKSGQRWETFLYSDVGRGTAGGIQGIKANEGNIVFSVLEDHEEELDDSADQDIPEDQDVPEDAETPNEIFYSVSFSLEGMEPTVLFQVNRTTTEVLDYWPDGDGKVYYITVERTETEENIDLKRCGIGEAEESVRRLNDFLQDGGSDCRAWKVQTVPDGGILIYSPDGYVLLDRAGNMLTEEIWEDEEHYDVICMSEKDRFVQVYENYGMNFYVCSEGGEKKVRVGDVPASGRYLYGRSSEGDALVCTDACLYSCDEEGETMLLCTWADYGIIGEDVVAFYLVGDDMHSLLYEEGTLKDVTYIDGEKPDKPMELTLGCFGDAYWIRRAAAEYNKESEYTISIVDYWQEDTAEAVGKMYNDILAGRGPDIICFESNLVNDAALGRAGMLEDLTAYLEESDVIGPEDFVDPLYEALDIDGKRYMLPTNFAVETMIAKKEWAGGESVWTPAECLKGVAANEDLAFGVDRGNVADILAVYGLYCAAEGQKNLEAYLKIAEYLPEQRVYISDYEMKRDGKVFMEFTWLSSAESYLYEKGQWGDDIRYAGIPGAEGNGMAFVPINCYGISSGSPNKEEAWRFIESLFAEEMRESVTPDDYFSARKDGLEEQLAEASKIAYYEDENGNLVKLPLFADRSEGMDFYAASQEDIDKIREIIGGIRLMRRENSAVAHIIGEEAGAYYAGDRTLDETIEIIENRIRMLSLENAL